MSGYSTTGLAQLERYINRQLLTPETVKTAFNEAAFFYTLNEGCKKKGGYQFEVKVRRRRTTDTAKTFLPWDSGSDYVGDDPATYPSATYSRKDPTRMLQVKMAFVHDNIRINQFEIDALDSDAKFVDYFDELADEMHDNQVEFLANQILRGKGDGQEGSTYGTATDMYGLYNQVSYGNFTDNTNLTESVLGSNTHFGIGRHLFPNMVGRVFDAGQVDTMASSKKITISSCTLTNGRTDIGFSSTDLTGAEAGWMVKITDASSNVTTGYEYRVGYLVATTGQTKLQMTQIWRGATASTYTVELYPFYRDDQDGDEGEWAVQKLYKALSAMRDGGAPDLASVNSPGFAQFLGHLEAKQRWTRAEDADLATKGFENFKFGTTTVTIDEHEDAGRVSFYNTKYCRMYWHQKYGMPKLKKGSLRLDNSGRHINSLIGDIICVGQPVVTSPKNCGAVIGLPTY